jgi:hypothetical protein
MSGYKHITPAQATATLTVLDYTALTGQEVTIDGVTFVEGAAADWTASISNDATASSLSGSISTVTNVRSTVLDNIVTLSYNLVGVVGNSATLSLSPQVPGTIEKSGDTFSGGSDGIISSDPVDITYVSAAAHPTGACTLKLYDGVDSTGTLVISLSCPQAKSSEFKLGKGIRFKNGCFVDIILANVAKLPTSVTVGYEKV